MRLCAAQGRTEDVAECEEPPKISYANTSTSRRATMQPAWYKMDAGAQIALAACQRPAALLVLVLSWSSIASSFASCSFSIRPPAADWPLGRSIIKLEVRVASGRCRVADRSPLQQKTARQRPLLVSSKKTEQAICTLLLHQHGTCQVFSCSTY
jgi:hypothetical protein